MSESKQYIKLLSADNIDEIEKKINNEYPTFELDELIVKHTGIIVFVAVMVHRSKT